MGKQNDKSDRVTEPEDINGRHIMSSCDTSQSGDAAGTSLELASASLYVNLTRPFEIPVKL